jgi:2-polyprenyl-3-methyl-5-hydroxy-6-metoxy-1,4-benzoquinol methylase
MCTTNGVEEGRTCTDRWHTAGMPAGEKVPSARTYETSQLASAGDSCPEIHAAAVEHARPQRELRWLDIGCGTGAVLRQIRDRHEPAQLIGLDVIDWLDDDMRDHVQLLTGPAETALEGVDPVDRVLMIEVLEHLEAPWTVLRAAARRIAPGGRLVVTTPNVTTLRHRLDLLVRGELTAFRPDNLPHLTPGLPHVIERVLRDEGLRTDRGYAGIDVLPLTGGRRWPPGLSRRFARLSSVSLVVTAAR